MTFIINRKIFSQAKTQVLGNLILNSRDAKTGGKNFAAFQKALVEIDENGTIEFDGKRLTFQSRKSGKPRNVTAAGCHESCECGNAVSYHRFLFAILQRCAELEVPTAKVLTFPVMSKTTVLEYQSAGTINFFCAVCAESALISAKATIGEIEKRRAAVKKHHAECSDREVHPHNRAYVARRITEIKGIAKELVYVPMAA